VPSGKPLPTKNTNGKEWHPFIVGGHASDDRELIHHERSHH